MATALNVFQVGVIGIGSMGRLYARIVQESPLARLVALVGNTPLKVEEMGRLFSVPAYAHGDFIRMFERHPEIDAVIIATPEWEHLHPTISALESGKHVLLEKPMAHNLHEAREILMAVEATDTVFMLCHLLRFDPRFALMREAIIQGAVGDVRYIYGRRTSDQQAAARILGHCHPAYWLTPHDIDIMRWITGGEIISVTAQAAVNAHEAADGFFSDVRFSTGALGRVENSWSTPLPNGRTRWGLFDVWGTHGNVELSPFEQGLMIYQADGSVAVPDTHEAPVLHGRIFGAFPALVEHFFRAAGGDHPPLVNVRDGLATIMAAAAMERSLAERREVLLEEL